MSDDPHAPGPVGYKRPPAQHQFQKGRSGNPRGRPRNAAKPAKVADLGDAILEEAYRTVSLREGEKVIELPVINAVLRSLGVAGMKGNRLAQIAIKEMVEGEEAKRAAAKQKKLEDAITYKVNAEMEIERCERQRLPDPELLPHPDDILINYQTGEVEIVGPADKKEKATWDVLLKRKRQAADDLRAHRKALRLNPEHPDRAFMEREITRQQRVYDMIDQQHPDEEIRRGPDFNPEVQAERNLKLWGYD